MIRTLGCTAVPMGATRKSSEKNGPSPLQAVGWSGGMAHHGAVLPARAASFPFNSLKKNKLPGEGKWSRLARILRRGGGREREVDGVRRIHGPKRGEDPRHDLRAQRGGADSLGPSILPLLAFLD